MNNYKSNASDHQTKREVREEIVKTLENIQGKDKYNRILTLPNLNFDLEIQALALGYKVNTVEIDKKTFNKQFELRNKLNIDHRQLTLNNECASLFLRKHPLRQYSLVYLDFCGFFSKEKDLIFRDISDRCDIVFVTFLLSREHAKYHHLFELGDKVFDYVKIFHSYGYSIERVFRYHNNKSPMCTFKLVKNKVYEYKTLKKVLPIKKKVVKTITPKKISIKSYGTLNKNLLFLNSQISKLGFSSLKSYLLDYDKDSNTIILKPSKLGINFTKMTWNCLQKNIAKFCIINNLNQGYYISNVQQTSNNDWKLKLEIK